MIILTNLCKTFIKDGNRIEVLRNLNLEIKKGDSLAVVGVSGAGKSTLIHILGTLDHPTSGTLSIAGNNVFEWSEKKIAAFRNRTIGFVFQFNNLLPEFTALENTMMPALIAGLPRRDASRKAGDLLAEVGLEHRLRHKPGELSGGEQQRVAIARALVMEPEILLADEPTGNLDTETGKKIEDILVNLNTGKNITLMVVTHNKLLADRMSGRIGLRDGEIYDL
ncbi:MAG: ABC transporter ATP-binding protein [Smithellaceae bacterium]|nr:ABC transporter ATP-binding protein [Syntrophaceae bacterium]MDD4241874.1 ABC transporter ATP-binding protein [Smithellaceae bacterium]